MPTLKVYMYMKYIYLLVFFKHWPLNNVLIRKLSSKVLSLLFLFLNKRLKSNRITKCVLMRGLLAESHSLLFVLLFLQPICIIFVRSVNSHWIIFMSTIYKLMYFLFRRQSVTPQYYYILEYHNLYVVVTTVIDWVISKYLSD